MRNELIIHSDIEIQEHSFSNPCHWVRCIRIDSLPFWFDSIDRKKVLPERLGIVGRCLVQQARFLAFPIDVSNNTTIHNDECQHKAAGETDGGR